jgi:hypothetical protein
MWFCMEQRCELAPYYRGQVERVFKGVPTIQAQSTWRLHFSAIEGRISFLREISMTEDVETNQGFGLEDLGVCWIGRHLE